jgi:23S rRNA (uracil1939-C5)-methyltransferase
MQLNYSVAAKIYSTIDSMISPTGLIFEAYCGIGGISIFLKNKAKKIIGVDISRPSIDNARINAKINSAENLEFIVGDAEQIMENILM